MKRRANIFSSTYEGQEQEQEQELKEIRISIYHKNQIEMTYHEVIFCEACLSHPSVARKA